MYKCADCGERFSEPEIVCDRHPYGMGYADEQHSCCPVCHSFDINEDISRYCEECGIELSDNESELCEFCNLIRERSVVA